MSVSYAECYYYCACSFLWSVFSAVEYVFEKVDAEEHYQRRAVWYDLHEDWSGWALDESTFVIKRHTSDGTPLERLFTPKRDVQSALFRRSTDAILAGAYLAANVYPPISAARWVYHAYCQWLWHILIAFDQIMQDVTMAAYSQRYQTRAAAFQALTDWMHDEQLTLSMVDTTNRQQVEPLLRTLDANAAQLARAWREAVVAVANHAAEHPSLRPGA